MELNSLIVFHKIGIISTNWPLNAIFPWFDQFILCIVAIYRLKIPKSLGKQVNCCFIQNSMSAPKIKGSRTKVWVDKSSSKQIFCSNYLFVSINEINIWWMMRDKTVNSLQFCSYWFCSKCIIWTHLNKYDKIIQKTI